MTGRKIGQRTVTDGRAPRRLMQFTDGLRIDPLTCPIGVLAHPHWRRTDGLEVAGEPNAECLCPKTDTAVA